MRSLLLLAAAWTTAVAWTVCLDPGHGGSQPGATGTYYLEKYANMDVAGQASFYLAMVPDCEWVGMTRTGDYDVSLQARCDYANQNGFDRFMSIHENAFNTYVQGSEVYVDPVSAGWDLGGEVLDGILWAHGYDDRGVKDGSVYYVIRNTSMTAILGEGSFIDYDDEWNESYLYYVNQDDHSGRQGWAYAAGISGHMGSGPPPYGPSPDLIVDNLDAGFSVSSESAWSTGAYGNPWEEDYRWSSTTDRDDWARWTPQLPEAGWYEVYVWYTEGGNRAPDAVFTVAHAGGETSFEVDQTEGGGQWNLLGGFGFEAGGDGCVTLSEEGVTTGRVVIADAVRFRPVCTGVESGTVPAPPRALDISAFPNPASSFTLRLDLPEAGPVRLEAYDLAGRLVDTIRAGDMDAGPGALSWTPTGLPPAVYIVVAVTDAGTASTRVVLTR